MPTTITTGGAGGLQNVAVQPLTGAAANAYLLYTTGSSYYDGSVTGVKVPCGTGPDLPPVVFNDYDETGRCVTMTLEFDPAFGHGDLAKIAMLLFAHQTNPSAFSVHAYVRKHALFRHFRIGTP